MGGVVNELSSWDPIEKVQRIAIFTWNSGSGQWEKQAPISAGGGGGPVTIADGADVAQGFTTDAAVTTDVNATISAKLRGIIKIFGDVWDSANHRLNVAVNNFPATQTVSGTVTANQGGAPWSQNVTQFGGVNLSTGTGTSGTGIPRVTVSSDSSLTSNQGTANTTANAWPIKFTDGTNVTAVKAASTAAVATDPSGVIQISPNQSQLTTPLNFQGGKTNNNAAPGTTNIGVLDVLANAAVPSWTEGNLVTLSADLAGALRVTGRPPNVLGAYRVKGRTATYTGLAAAAPLFSMRWGVTPQLAIILRVKVFVVTTAAATTAGLTERELIIARSFTASDTGGTAVTLTGNNQKMRTSQATSLVTNMQFGAPLTAGTRTLDANPIASAGGWSPLSTVGIVIGSSGAVAGTGMISLYDITRDDYPIVLAQNEGIIVRIGPDAEPTGATQQTYVEVDWLEVNAY